MEINFNSFFKAIFSFQEKLTSSLNPQHQKIAGIVSVVLGGSLAISLIARSYYMKNKVTHEQKNESDSKNLKRSAQKVNSKVVTKVSKKKRKKVNPLTPKLICEEIVSEQKNNKQTKVTIEHPPSEEPKNKVDFAESETKMSKKLLPSFQERLDMVRSPPQLLTPLTPFFNKPLARRVLSQKAQVTPLKLVENKNELLKTKSDLNKGKSKNSPKNQFEEEQTPDLKPVENKSELLKKQTDLNKGKSKNSPKNQSEQEKTPDLKFQQNKNLLTSDLKKKMIEMNARVKSEIKSPVGEKENSDNQRGVEEKIVDEEILDGQAKIELPSGIIVEGQFKNGKLNGKGKKTFPNGVILEGTFKNGKLTGPGQKTRLDGLIIEGNFKDNMLNGPGKSFRPEDHSLAYEGEFKDDLCHGYGKQYITNTKYWEGSFKNDWMHGKVKVMDKGVLLREIEVDNSESFGVLSPIR